MSKKYIFDGKGEYFDCLHFVWQGTEFEVRVTNEVDDIPHDKLRLEVWTVLYEDDDVGNPDKLLGFDEFVKEINEKNAMFGADSPHSFGIEAEVFVG